MPVKTKSLLLFLSAGLLPAFAPLQAAELSTLFTTPQERQIINSNRYKSDEVKPVVEEVEEVEVVVEAMQPMFLEEVTQTYQISGISVGGESAPTVWINSMIYEDGESLEDSSRIKVVSGESVRVRITAPDGKHYFGTSGETVEITYMAPMSPVEN